MLTNMENATNKVYINPNFNRTQGNNLPTNGVMHVNPRFSHLLSNVQSNVHNKPKIYVNPNFVKSTKCSDSSGCITNANVNSIQRETINSTSNSYNQIGPKTEKKSDIVVPIAKSRYSLVRHNATKVLSGVIVEKCRNTYQVNKYKSIPLKDIRSKLEYPKKSETKQPCTHLNNISNKKYSVSSTSSKSQFKLVNNKNIVNAVRHDKITIKPLIDTKKVQINNLRMKKSKGNLKKNNIPCPMYRKFGKCLRQMRGNCEFLHDKKHVAICRKFIKGLCHDKDCLLSHDLTTKKMPTCYFYLQGTCTKPDCPYLHVKISEKVKVCPDFLKGYCEKGSKCLLRHIHNRPEKPLKGSIMTRSITLMKKKYIKVKNKSLDFDKIKKSNEDNILTENKESSSDCRYYQEQKVANTSDNCEIIKPMRCKLGTLPSFIQL